MALMTDMLEPCTIIAQTYTAIERWRQRDWPTMWSNLPSWQNAVIFLSLALTAVLAVLVVMQLRRESQVKTRFNRRCEELGLDPLEKRMLTVLAKTSYLKDPRSIFIDESAFEESLSVLVSSRKVSSLSQGARQQMSTTLDSLLIKLGFQKHVHGKDGITSSRQISEGTKVTIGYAGVTDEMAAVVCKTSSLEMVIEPEVPVKAQVGQYWRVRYGRGSAVWEFDAPVIRCKDGKLTVGHTNKIRFINRRRFPRIPTSKPAFVAIFPFAQSHSQEDLPRFVPVRLVEIAGPGLGIEPKLDVKAGDSVLVVIKLEDKNLQGLANVIRTRAIADGRSSIVVELLALNDSIIAELASETHLAECEAKRASSTCPRAFQEAVL
jgi:hypothetical protein